MDKIFESIGQAIVYGGLIAAIAFGVSACGNDNKWMQGKDLVESSERSSPEAQALIASFDRDNGKVYCVPKMSGAELGEFRTKIPGLMIGNLFGGIMNGEGLKDFNQDKPIESVLRMTFTKSYPCK